MKAIAAIPGRSGSLGIVNADVPMIGAEEVLVKTLYVGVDGTDREIAGGLYGSPPGGLESLVLGHESLGEVEESCDDFEKGDLVVPTVRRPCPQNCINCKGGATDMCVTGDYLERGIKGLPGFMSEYFAEDAKYLVNVPRNLRSVGVLLEPLSVVEKAVEQAYKIQERLRWEPQNALVLGAGPIGLFATMLLGLKDLNVHTLDIVPGGSTKASLVKRTGANYLNGKEAGVNEIPETVADIDIIIEATGDSTVALNALSILGRNGAMCLTSVTGGSRMLEVCSDCINLQMVLGNKVLYGSVNSNTEHLQSAIEHMQEIERTWPGVMESMITRKVKPERFGDAFEKKPDDIKVVLEF